MITRKFNKTDDAVSPVVGVMLMLVVTIVIAAVVAVFAGGIGGSVDAKPTIVIGVDMGDDGLVISCEGASSNLTYGEDFEIYINSPNDLENFISINGEDVALPATSSDGNTKYASGYNEVFSPGKSIVFTFQNLINSYQVLNGKDSNQFKNGSNKQCWTWGGSNGGTIGLPVKVQLRLKSTGEVIAEGTGLCHRSS